MLEQKGFGLHFFTNTPDISVRVRDVDFKVMVCSVLPLRHADTHSCFFVYHADTVYHRTHYTFVPLFELSHALLSLRKCSGQDQGIPTSAGGKYTL